MIIKYYNGYVNIEKLRDMTKTNKDGTTAYDIVQASKQIGFNSYGVEYELKNKNVDNLILPAIAHVIIDNSYYHFIVVYEINYKKNYLIIADPATGVKKMSFSEFKIISTNNFIIMYPIKKILKEEELHIFNFFKDVILSHKLFILFLFFITFIILILSVLLLLIIKLILNKKSNHLFILLFLIIILKNFLGYIRDKRITKFDNNINLDLLNNTFKNIVLLPYRYYRNRNTGEVISRINDVDNISNFIIIFVNIITNILILILSTILLFLISKEIFIVLLIISSLYVILYSKIIKKISNLLNELKVKKGNINTFEVEKIQGFESIKGLNLENKTIANFNNMSIDYYKKLDELEQIKNISNHLKNLFNDLSMFLILVFGIYLVYAKKLSYVNLILIYSLYNYFITPIESIINSKVILNEIKISLKRILELNYIVKNKKKLKRIKNIEFKNVCFKNEDKLVLKNLNLKLNHKDKIMMIGKSGSGKSTILKLINQYYETNDMFVDGVNSNDVNIKSRISFISQNEYLFTDTLYNNIMFNDKKNINKILEICELKEIIKKKDLGLNMLIEENGFNLSGGEKQRIILARTLNTDFDYLLIDEGLSEVDINMERRIIKKLFKNYNDKTIIIVSHRLDNMDLFNKIIKVDNNFEVIEKNGGNICGR